MIKKINDAVLWTLRRRLNGRHLINLLRLLFELIVKFIDQSMRDLEFPWKKKISKSSLFKLKKIWY